MVPQRETSWQNQGACTERPGLGTTIPTSRTRLKEEGTSTSPSSGAKTRSFYHLAGALADPSQDMLPQGAPARSSASIAGTAWTRLPVPYLPPCHLTPLTSFSLSVPVSQPTYPKPHAVPSCLLPAHCTGMLKV